MIRDSIVMEEEMEIGGDVAERRETLYNEMSTSVSYCYRCH